MLSLLSQEIAMASGAFEIERDGDTLIVTPLNNLRELEFPQIETGAKEILSLLSSASVKNVIVDFHKTDYYGSTALGFFVKLWKRVRERKGRMVFCNVSDHEREILNVMRLDKLWPVRTSRDEARQALLEPD
jgi:anti-anti-sigma factor